MKNWWSLLFFFSFLFQVRCLSERRTRTFPFQSSCCIISSNIFFLSFPSLLLPFLPVSTFHISFYLMYFPLPPSSRVHRSFLCPLFCFFFFLFSFYTSRQFLLVYSSSSSFILFPFPFASSRIICSSSIYLPPVDYIITTAHSFSYPPLVSNNRSFFLRFSLPLFPSSLQKDQTQSFLFFSRPGHSYFGMSF